MRRRRKYAPGAAVPGPVRYPLPPGRGRTPPWAFLALAPLMVVGAAFVAAFLLVVVLLVAVALS